LPRLNHTPDRPETQLRNRVRIYIEGRELPDPNEPPPHECRKPDRGMVCIWAKCPRQRPCPLDHALEWRDYLDHRKGSTT
jgi:hypothetical protein